MINRRNFLSQAGSGFGALALASMLHQHSTAADSAAMQTLHHPPRIKRVVQLFMAGAASHIDLWDYRPLRIGRAMQIGQVDIAHLGHRPLVRWRRGWRVQLVSNVDSSQGHSRGFLALLAANPLALLIEQRHPLLRAWLGVVPAVRLFPMPGRSMLLVTLFAVPCHWSFVLS